MLEPHWLKVTTDPLERCEGDPIQMIMGKIMSEAVKIPEGIINNILKDLNSIDILGIKPFNFDLICWDLPPWEPDRSKWNPCGEYGSDGRGNTHKCEDDSNGAENLCYYARVRSICLSPENNDNYEALFDLGYQSSDDLRAQYAAAFGDSYEFMAPELANLLAAVDSDTRDYSYERDICDDVKLFHAMTLDMVIESCVFAILRDVCSSEDTEDTETFIRSIEWRLPDVGLNTTCPRRRRRRGRRACTSLCCAKTAGVRGHAHPDGGVVPVALAHRDDEHRLDGGRLRARADHHAQPADQGLPGDQGPQPGGARRAHDRGQAHEPLAVRVRRAGQVPERRADRRLRRGGRGAEGGFPQADGFQSNYDRNKLTYWALHYYMSYVHDATDEPLFEPLRLYQEMCTDACAYRVPVPTAVWKSQGTYKEQRRRTATRSSAATWARS